MHIFNVIDFFLKQQNKIGLLAICFAKSMERATILYLFLSLLVFVCAKSQTDAFAVHLGSNLKWFLPLAIFIGIFREISFRYKDTL